MAIGCFGRRYLRKIRGGLSHVILLRHVGKKEKAGRGGVSLSEHPENLLRNGHHQLDAFVLIVFTGSGIVIKSDNVRIGITGFDFVDQAFSRDVVRQASERLNAQDVVYARIQQFDDFSGQQPAFARLVSQRNDAFCFPFQFLEEKGRFKTLAEPKTRM